MLQARLLFKVTLHLVIDLESAWVIYIEGEDKRDPLLSIFRYMKLC